MLENKLYIYLRAISHASFLISLNCTAIESARLPAKSPLPAAEQNVHPPCATVPSRLGQSNPPSNATLNIFVQIYF